MSEHEEVTATKPAPKRKVAPKKPAPKRKAPAAEDDPDAASKRMIAAREADAKKRASAIADKYAPPAEAPAKEEPKVKTPAKKKVVAEDGSIGGNARKQLSKLKDRILNLEEEKAEIGADIKEVYAEAKSMGFDTKILRKVVAASKRSPEEVDAERAMFDLYADAVGLYAKLEG